MHIDIPSGKFLHNKLETHHVFSLVNEHYKSMAMASPGSFNKLPESKYGTPFEMKVYSWKKH